MALHSKFPQSPHAILAPDTALVSSGRDLARDQHGQTHATAGGTDS